MTGSTTEASERQAFDASLSRVCERSGWGQGDLGIEVDLEGGRRQRVSLEFFDFEGRELARFYTTIGSASRIDPLRLTQALRVSFGLPHGALALKDDDLVMVDTLMLGKAQDRKIESALRYLAQTADHFEKTMFGPDEH